MIYLIYGVTASGKTSVGKLLSRVLKVPFYDADDFHEEYKSYLEHDHNILLEIKKLWLHCYHSKFE